MKSPKWMNSIATLNFLFKLPKASNYWVIKKDDNLPTDDKMH